MSDPVDFDEDFSGCAPQEWERLPIPFGCSTEGCGNESMFARDGKQFCAAHWAPNPPPPPDGPEVTITCNLPLHRLTTRQ